MTHRNAPLTALGRQRAVAQVVVRGRPIAHVAAELRIARATLSKWVARYRAEGEAGLLDRPSAPATRPSRLPVWVVELIEKWRRDKKWSARRIARELAEGHGVQCCVRTVTRWLDRLGLNRIRDITPEGEDLRRAGKIIARYPGHMVHMDVKKVGKIPDGGGWWAHGRGSDQALAGKRAHKQKVGYTYLHSMEDGFSRLACTEALENETAVTTSAFIGRQQRTRAYTPRHNGKIERYQRLMTDECLYARAYDSENERRDAIGVWNHHYNYCESWSGWSGTGWQGEHRAAPVPRPWLIQLLALKRCVSMDLSGSGVGWPARTRPAPMA